VTRVVSGAVLVVIAVAVVWFAPPLLFFAVAELLVVGAAVEYTNLARAHGAAMSAPTARIGGLAALLVAAAFARLTFGLSDVPIDLVLMVALVTLGIVAMAEWREGLDALRSVSTGAFPALYLGLPIGAMIAIREERGREALLLLMLTVAISDTAQYYTGRAFGRRPLAPAISPKKTIEGALGGFVAGIAVLALVGRWWLPQVNTAVRAGLGLLIVAFGIAGDLFESMLKRSAGVKDSSALIPGHGGVLDRIDALLFAAPVYYVVLRYA
jgi:phosphatidate cytidylyltransferase